MAADSDAFLYFGVRPLALPLKAQVILRKIAFSE
jgi:hypothetical protein